MSFINWGSESPEQLAIRRQIEERLLFEQAARVSQARNRAGNTPGVAGGGGGGSAPSITEATTILEYNTSQGASLVWNGVTFTLDTSLPNYSYTAIITTIPASTVPSAGSLIEVTVGNSVTSIGSAAFSACIGLTSVTFSPNSTLTSIGNTAFEGCSTLVSITIPSSVTSIGANAFRICEVLASITIPDSVTNIGNYAFNYTNLTTVTFSPNSTLTSIGVGAMIVGMGYMIESHSHIGRAGILLDERGVGVSIPIK